MRFRGGTFAFSTARGPRLHCGGRSPNTRNSSSLTKTTKRGVILTARTLIMTLIYGFCDAVLQEVQTGVSRSARSSIINAQLIMIDQGVYTGQKKRSEDLKRIV